MTAEQVLNHLLPALAGIKPSLSIKVNHRKSPAARRTEAKMPQSRAPRG
jgi:hypothetical protein